MPKYRAQWGGRINSELGGRNGPKHARVQVKYSEIAIVTHKTQQDAFADKGPSAITDALREEACKLGADGLIMKNVTQGTWGDPDRGEGIAIKYE